MRIFGSPRQYIQGPGALGRLGEVARVHGGTPLIVADRPVRLLLGSRLTESFDVPPPTLDFAGQITMAAIATLAAEARSLLGRPASVLVFGVGGGKALDAAKAVALRFRADFVSVPTIASNDSPAGRAIAIYDDHHRLARVDYMDRSPEAVIVDTEVIACAPARFLRSGIGDAIAKQFEARRAQADGARNFFDGTQTLSAIALADASYAAIRYHGAAAMRDAEAHVVTADLEAVIEASILMAGIAWESGGVSLAHAVVRGIARSRGASNSLHGEHVAYGLLVQLAIEGRDDDFIVDLIHFYAEIGQATSLRGLGLVEDGVAAITQIADWVTDGPKGGKVIVSASVDEIVSALVRVERLAREHPDVMTRT